MQTYCSLEREKINIELAARKMRLVFMVMGAILIVAFYLCKLLGLSEWNVYLLMVVLFAGLVILLLWINLDLEMVKINKTVSLVSTKKP